MCVYGAGGDRRWLEELSDALGSADVKEKSIIECLESPRDLLYAFANEAQAEYEGGKCIAKMWSVIKESGVGEVPSDWNLVRSHVKRQECSEFQMPEPSKAAMALRKPKGLRAKTADKRQRTDEEDRIEKAAKELLCTAMTWEGSRLRREMKEAGKKGHRAWVEATVDNIKAAGNPITKAATLRSWMAFCDEAAVTPMEAQPRHVKDFIEKGKSAKGSAANRGKWYQLDWLRRTIDAPIPTDAVACPKKAKQVLEAKQAVAADPEVFFLVEEETAKMGEDDEEKVYGFAHLVLYQTVMRPRHLIRSSLLELGTTLVKAVLWWGKGVPGHTWYLPRYSPAGIDVGGSLWKQWLARCQGAKKLPKGIFHEKCSGAPLEYAEVLGGCRRFLAERLGMVNAMEWTTYSNRRALPTAMMYMEVSQEKTEAAGGWVSRGTNMPVRYSAAKLATSMLARAEVMDKNVQVKARSEGHLTWEMFQYQQNFVDVGKAKRRAAKMLADNRVVERAPKELVKDLNIEERRFSFGGVKVAKSAKKKEGS